MIGGAIAGALITTTSYLSTSENPTVGGAIGAFVIGAVVGGLGGAAGATYGWWSIGFSVAAGLVSGLYTTIMTDGTFGQKALAGFTATVISGGGAYLGALVPLGDMSIGYTTIGNAIFGGTIGGYLEILNAILQGWIGNGFQNYASNGARHTATANSIISGAHLTHNNSGLNAISAIA